MNAGDFAAVAITLYAAHHVGDYWVQTDHQARHKGDAGSDGVLACLMHVATYTLTQVAFLAVLLTVAPWEGGTGLGILVALIVSGVTHYLADRREHGLMLWLARHIPGKAAFIELGRPRDGGHWVKVTNAYSEAEPVKVTYNDNPQLATGAWALDQAWHIFWGVWVAALLAVTL